jgi:signal transduction histidine kinase
MSERAGTPVSEAQTLRALHEVAVAVGGVLDPQQLAGIAAAHARDLLGADKAVLHLWDPAAEVLRTLSATAAVSLTHPPIAARSGISGQAFERRAPLLIDDYAAWEHALPWAVACGVRSAAAVPLLVADRAIGTLTTFFPIPNACTPERTRALALLAAQVAPALEAARLYQQTQEALRARDEFLSIASHELRTPVAGIKGFAQLLLRAHERGQLDPERLGRSLRTINEAADRLTGLTHDLLDVSRIRTGQLILRPRPFDLTALARDLVGRYDEAAAPGHCFRLEAPAAAPLEGDADRIEQVLVNLLDNAAKYSPDGGEILVRVVGQAGGLALGVQDPGIGLPAEAVETIFQPFGRAPNAARRNLPGMGLGLYICRSIVERHGGRIWADSEGEGRGTAITAWLPASAPLPPDRHEPAHLVRAAV